MEKAILSRVKDIINDAVTELTQCSSDRRKREVLFRTHEGSEKETVGNWAFLVDRGNAEDFRNRIFRANAENTSNGLFFDLSGPWPPYSFAPTLRMELEA